MFCCGSSHKITMASLSLEVYCLNGFLRIFFLQVPWVYILWLLVLCFSGIPVCATVYGFASLWFLVLFLWLFFFLVSGFILFQSVCFCFPLLYLILLLFLDDAYLLSKERQTGCGVGWEGKWGGAGKTRGGEVIIRLYCMAKKTIFNKRKCFFKKSNK